MKGGVIVQSKMSRKNLKKWHIDQNLTPTKVAEMLGVTYAHYASILSGRNNPSIKLLEKFQEIFKVDDVLELFKKSA